MGQDQKPGKLRVVGGGRTPAAAQSKADEQTAKADAAAPPVAAPAPAPSLVMPLILFLLACAGGGAGVAWLRSAGMLG